MSVILAGLLFLAQSTGLRGYARFADPRDGEAYRVVEIGEQAWMAENLRFQSPRSRCYDDSLRNCARLGRLYPFDDAASACPPGWRLPSDQDWMRLEAAVGVPEAELRNDRDRGAAARAGERLKAGGDSGFNGLYAGYDDPHDRAFQRLDQAAAFWTSSEEGRDDVSPLAWHRDLDVRRTGIWRSLVNVTYRLSVRCVADRSDRPRNASQ
jgi:uncharacterized protein (TIGR02145 family)